MTVQTGQTVTVDFTTHSSTGALVNADSLPTGTLVLNGTDNGATVTVTNKATGTYKATVTLPTLAIKDIVQIRINATVASVADGDYIWTDSKDVLLDAFGGTLPGVVRSGTAQAGTTSTLTLDAGASAVNSYYNDCWVTLLAGTGAGQTRQILTYTGATRQALMGRAWAVAPDGTSVFAVLATDSPQVTSSGGVVTSVPAVAIRSSILQAGSTSNTAVLDTNASATSNIYYGNLLTVTSGTGAGQTRTVISYNGTTKVATVDKNWVTFPLVGSGFNLYASTTATTFSDQGVLQAATASTGTLASTASAVDSIYVGSIITILSGTGSGDTAEITGYVGATRVATISGTWAVTPDSTSAYAVIPTQSGTGSSPSSTDVNVVSWGGASVSAAAGGKPSTTLAAADVSGNLPADLQTVKAQAVTCAAPVTVLASVGTAATSTAQTGDGYPTAANLATALELNAGAYRFTSAALANAPTGSGTVNANVISIGAGVITEAAFTTPAETAGRPTGILGMIRRLFEWACNKKTRDRSTGTVLLRDSTDSTTLETQTQATVTTVDSQTKGV